MGELEKVDAQGFEANVLGSDIPVVLDFWGPRCVPCIRLEPFVAQLSDEFAGRVKVNKVVAPENRLLCVKLRVMSLPTILAFAGGEEIGRLSGEAEVSRETIRTLVETVAAAQSGG